MKKFVNVTADQSRTRRTAQAGSDITTGFASICFAPYARAYRSHGFQTTYWATHLNIWMDLLQKDLSPDAWQQIHPFYNWLIINIPVFTAVTDTELTGSLSNSPDHLHGASSQR